MGEKEEKLLRMIELNRMGKYESRRLNSDVFIVTDEDFKEIKGIYYSVEELRKSVLDR